MHARAYTHTHAYTHVRRNNTNVDVHNRREMVLQRNSFYARTSPAGTFENSFQHRLSETLGRLFPITVDRRKLSPDRFSRNRCPIILPPRATRKTTCYALLVSFSFFPSLLFFFRSSKLDIRWISVRSDAIADTFLSCDLLFILFSLMNFFFSFFRRGTRRNRCFVTISFAGGCGIKKGTRNFSLK